MFPCASWGNSSLIRLGVTPTSSNPAKATAFAIARGRKWGSGILHIADISRDLKGVAGVAGNVLAGAESEFPLSMLPSEFAERSSITITSNQAREILKKMGIDVPLNITEENITDMVFATVKIKVLNNDITVRLPIVYDCKCMLFDSFLESGV